MKKNLILPSILVLLGILLSACQYSISRNNDGSLTATTTISQQELQSEINAAIADPLIKDLTVTLQNGYITVTGQRHRLNDASKMDALSFRLDLGVSNGNLTASISNAVLDGVAIEQNRIDLWNQTIANRLQKLGQRRPNSTLESVTVNSDSVVMLWKIK